MTQQLKPGENTALTHTQGKVEVTHKDGDGLDVNLTAFLVTDAGKVQNDEGMVFFNAPVHPSSAASFIEPARDSGQVKHAISFDLNRLPAGVTKIAITLTQDGPVGGFAAVRDLRARVIAGDQVLELVPGAFDQETGIIVLELYVRGGQAKARSVWQGFASGLAGLCGMYGVEVDDAPPAPAAAQPPASPVKLTKTVITLEKPGTTHKVSLEKGPSAPKVIKVSATWVDNGDGCDNDDLDLRIGILRPDGRMSIIQAPDKSGAFTADPYVLHTGDVVSASASAPGTETVEINPAISRLLGGRVALVCSVYSAVDNGDVEISSLKPKMRMEYGDQVVECAFEFKKGGFFNSSVYTYVLGTVVVDGDEITISPSGTTSRSGSEATPWLTWKGDKLELTMDGPYVFKGHPPERMGNKQYV